MLFLMKQRNKLWESKDIDVQSLGVSLGIGDLEFDHIRGRSNNSIENCQALCPTHHRLKTKRDAIKAKITKTSQYKQRKT